MAEETKPQAPRSLPINDSKAICCYANLVRVSGTAEELMIDFGLNSQAVGGDQAVDIQQRIVLSYYTAKRLLHALHVSVQRHEQVFGTIETDISKRANQDAAQQGANG